MTNLVWLIPGLPLIGFTLLLLFGRRLGEPQAGWLATALPFRPLPSCWMRESRSQKGGANGGVNGGVKTQKCDVAQSAH